MKTAEQYEEEIEKLKKQVAFLKKAGINLVEEKNQERNKLKLNFPRDAFTEWLENNSYFESKTKVGVYENEFIEGDFTIRYLSTLFQFSKPL